MDDGDVAIERPVHKNRVRATEGLPRRSTKCEGGGGLPYYIPPKTTFC